MSFKRVCCFLLFELVISIPLALMIYWLLSLRTNNFTGDNMLIYLHGVVMMFTFTYLLAQGTALIRVCPSSRQCAKITHSVFNTLAMVFAIAGIILIVSYKWKYRMAHFQSIHSWCGLFLVFILMIQFVGGSIVLQSCCKGASLKSRMNYIPSHVAMGTATILMAVVTIVSGFVNVKDFLDLGPVNTRDLSFENSILNLMAVLSALVFLVILCVVVSRRTRQTIDYSANSNDGEKVGLYQVETKTMSSNKSKHLSCDTAYSDFSSAPDSAIKAAHHHGSGSRSDQPAGQSRRSSGDARKQSEQLSPPTEQRSARGRDSDQGGPRNGDPRDPQYRDPLSPGSLRSKRPQQDPRSLQDHPLLSPSSRSPATRPGDLPRQQSSPSFHNHIPPHHHPYLEKRGSCPAGDTSYHDTGYHDNNYHERSNSQQGTSPHRSPPTVFNDSDDHNMVSPPDIPPLFENNPQGRGSRRDKPKLALNIPPPPPQFNEGSAAFPSQYGGQVEPPVSSNSPPAHKPLSPHRSEPISTSSYNNPLSPPSSYPSNNGSVLSPELSPTSPPVGNSNSFNGRPMNRHQVARQIRYETRRAKVEQANLELQRSNTPPTSTSYTHSLAPNKPRPSSPLSPSISNDSIISEDVDGIAPRRGRTSYRNAVRDENSGPALPAAPSAGVNPLTPPAKPPKPSHMMKNVTEKQKKSDEDIRWL